MILNLRKGETKFNESDLAADRLRHRETWVGEEGRGKMEAEIGRCDHKPRNAKEPGNTRSRRREH